MRRAATSDWFERSYLPALLRLAGGLCPLSLLCIGCNQSDEVEKYGQDVREDAWRAVGHSGLV